MQNILENLPEGYSVPYKLFRTKFTKLYFFIKVQHTGDTDLGQAVHSQNTVTVNYVSGLYIACPIESVGTPNASDPSDTRLPVKSLCVGLNNTTKLNIKYSSSYTSIS